MSTITVQELQRDPAAFLNRVETGEFLVVTRDNHPVAEVKPVQKPERKPRPYGLCAGMFKAPADFDAPLPEEILNEFEAL